MTFCTQCGVSDLGRKLMIINDEEWMVCASCEAEDSVRDIDYEEWVEMMEADEADRHNDELAVYGDD